jgi:ferredoxin-type protein NapH
MIDETKKSFSLPTIFLLMAAMGFWSYFFIVARAVGVRQVSAWVVYAGVMTVYFLMLYTGNVSRYRRILFVSIALMFFPEFIGGLLESRGTMMLGAEEMFKNETPYCHIVTSMVLVPYVLTQKVIFPAGVNWIYSMLIIWGAATLIIGRGWCSWACFYGGWDEGISRIARKVRLKIAPDNDKARYFGFAMLAFVVLASLGILVPVYCEWLCPFKLVTEFGEVNSLRSYATFIVFVLIFFGIVVALPFLTKKRFQCMSFCPMGAFQSLLNKANLYRVTIDKEKCVGCMACVKSCPTMSLKMPADPSPRENSGPANRIPDVLLTCTRCGECMTRCPKGAIDYSYVFCKDPSVNPWQRLLLKLEGKNSRFAKLLKPVIVTVYEILSPRALFTFSGYFIGMVFIGTFGPATIHRLINWFVNGTFLLK